MKSLTLKIVIPLTVISFETFTKWWYTLPVDAPDTMFSGFPFPFIGDGWHTSMSYQIFVTAFITDLLTYFAFWFSLICLIDRFVTKIRLHKSITITLWTLSGIIIAFGTFVAFDSNHLYYLKRPYDMEIMETGFKFGWQNLERPDFYKYHPQTKQK